jgi:hypothetical protein
LRIADYDTAAGVVVKAPAEAPAEGDDILIPVGSLSAEDGRGCDETMQERRRAVPRSERTRRAFDHEHGDGGSVARGHTVSFEQAPLGMAAGSGAPAIAFCCVPGLAGLEGGGRTYDEWVAVPPLPINDDFDDIVDPDDLNPDDDDFVAGGGVASAGRAHMTRPTDTPPSCGVSASSIRAPPARPIDPTASHGCLLDIMQLSACFGVAVADDPQTLGVTVCGITADDARPGFADGDARRCGADAAGARAARRASGARSSGLLSSVAMRSPSRKIAILDEECSPSRRIVVAHED